MKEIILQVRTLKWYAFLPIIGYALWMNKTDNEKQLALVFAYHALFVGLLVYAAL